MSESWPPSAGSEDATKGVSADADPSAPTTESPIPLGPASSEHTPEPPTPGSVTPYPPSAPYPGELYRPQPFYAGGQYPTDENPAVGIGSPTPPAGTWPSDRGTGAPVMPLGGGWGGGPGGAMPPTGGWPPPPGFAGPYAMPSAPKKRGGLVVAMVTLFAVVAILAGAGLGHFVWPVGTSSSATSSPSATLPGSSGSSGSETSPFGSGSSGSSGSTGSSGSSGSTGNSSTGAGAPSDISAIATKVDPDLVDINTNLSYEDEQAAGTGMVLTSSGEILTNNHVIDGATSISVTDVGNGKTYSANVVGYDRTSDVAVVKLVGASGLKTVSTSSGTAAVGQAVVGVGNAGGTGGTPSAAGGSITAMNQSITASDDGGGNSENLSGLIETNAGIEPGDSGGSLVNTSGQVLGMDTAASEDTSYTDSASQGYAIPIATALSIAKKIEDGDASTALHIGATGFLGVSVESSSSAGTGSTGGSGGFGTGGDGGFGSGGSGFGSGTGSSGGSGTTTSGAVVEGTLSGSPAAQAGLVEGDVITGLNGSTVNSSTDLSNLLVGYHPGDTVQLQWTDQSGQTHTASVKLTSGPPS
jgi:S1-C subfamily serine protease